MIEKIQLPKSFFLGAAASAWQTEGWMGKKKARTVRWIPGIKMSHISGMMAMDQQWPQILLSVIKKILLI